MTEEENLTFKMFSDDTSTSSNVTEDDDIILASQAQKNKKFKPIIKLETLRENSNITETDILPTDKSYNSYKNYSFAGQHPHKHSTPVSSFKNTQEDIFISHRISERDQKVPKGSFIRNNDSIDFKSNVLTDKTEIINTDLAHKLAAELFCGENVETSNKSFQQFPVKNEGSLNAKNKQMFKSYEDDMRSQVLFTQDSTLSRVYPESYPDEPALTSGIVLPTKPRICQTENNLPCYLKRSHDAFKKEIMNNNIYEGSISDNIESSPNYETITFNLSVSCLVVKCSKTNKIKEKSIISVNELSNASEYEGGKMQESTKLRKFSIDDNIGCSKTKNFAHEFNDLMTKIKTSIEFDETIKIDENDDCEDCTLGTPLPGSGVNELSDDDNVNNKIPWANEYLVSLKLDELFQRLEQNAANTKRDLNRRGGTPYWMLCEGKFDNVREKQEKHEIEEDVALFPSGRPESMTVVLSSLASQIVSDTGISRRSFENEEEVEVLEEALEETQELLLDLNKSCEEPRNVCFKVDKEGLTRNVKQGEKEKEREVDEIAGRAGLRTPKKLRVNETGRRIRLEEGQSVLAKRTFNQQYHPGNLLESQKDNCWWVKFNNGKVKIVPEDEIIPWKWLQPGDLVSVSTENGCSSGKIMEMDVGDETTYNVELDENNQRMIIRQTDLFLTDAMVDILKERFSLLRPKSSPKKLEGSINKQSTPDTDKKTCASAWTLKKSQHFGAKRKKTSEPDAKRYHLFSLIKKKRERTSAITSARVNGRRRNTRKRNKRKKVKKSILGV